MKTLFLLLTGTALFGLNGFSAEAGEGKFLLLTEGEKGKEQPPQTEPSQGAVGQNPTNNDWPARLNGSTWQERKKAVNEWRTALPHLTPHEILIHLIPRIYDKSRKVREIIPTVFTDLANSYPDDPILSLNIMESVMNNTRVLTGKIFSIETVAKKILSHSSYKVRLNTIALLEAIALEYLIREPPYHLEINRLLTTRKEQEPSHRVKIALKKALRTLQKARERDRSKWREWYEVNNCLQELFQTHSPS